MMPQIVADFRTAYKKGQLSQGPITRLEGLPGWVWDPVDQQWEEALSALEAHTANCVPP